MRILTGMIAVLAGWLAGRGTLSAEDRVDYLRQVKPVLAARCFSCHGALQQKSGLRLDTAALMKQGGDAGPAFISGKTADSPLLSRITSTGKSRMPPASEGEPLKESEIAAIKAWIEQGAAGPTDEKPETDPKDHWAFKPVRRPAVPEIRNPKSPIANPIDAFLSAKRQAAGLQCAPEADRRVLLRRVYLDLIGLPPTREEQATFVADTSPKAYEKVVDRLLASKQYGERWGRHWMDVWRYSDWWGLGAEVRNSQKHIWHWRDWIIESLNADTGYDQMLREMLAGDELYPNDLSKLRATGYLARSYFIFNRTTWLDEVVEHTSKAFLGLTFNCSKCHDHKYDPISHKDYYRMRAFFEPYQVRMDMAAGEPDFAKDGIPRVFDCNLDTPTYLHVRGDEKQADKTKPLAPGLPAILSLGQLAIKPVPLPLEAHSTGLRTHVLDGELRMADARIKAARAALEQARNALADAEKNSKPIIAPPKTDAPPAAPILIVRDDFSKMNSEVWEMKTGKWTYRGGKLLQQEDGPNRGVIGLKQQPPTDFQARVKFAILGGQMWKSVGLAFDVTGDNEMLVYISAVSGGSKLQISYKEGGAYLFPPEGMQARAVNLNDPQEMTVRVRGQLVNVAVNGQHALAYRLPLPRRAGKMELVTYDAKAEFSAFELTALPAEIKLIEGAIPAAGKPATAEQARLALIGAEKALAAAEAMPAALKARAAAERAKYQQPPAANARELAQQAARAEKQAALAAAEDNLARAEAERNAAKIGAARTALAAAKKSLENPGEAYTPLRGSIKTPETNLETEASRNKPYPTASTGRRTALANWMTDPRHPLTARVAVNHIWMRHMGKPLVPTVFDFGRKGTPPAHPELLDWLAAELTENRWSMKHLHKLIVTSNTYRMSSSSAGAAGDPENRNYWRMNPVRMQSEVIRDSLLHLSGELDLALGGPSIPTADETTRRRSLYFVHSHNDHQRFLTIFDDANVLECYRRAESIVPQQALALENSKLALVAAEKIARRMADMPDTAFVRGAFETVLGVSPSAEEQTECARALKEWQELAVREKKPDAGPRARANLIHALLNHNDFVTIR